MWCAAGTGNITGLRPVLFNRTVGRRFVDFLVSEAVARGYDGINVDFEPRTDVLDPDNNPTIADAVALAGLISALGDRLHTVNKSLSLDAMAVTGACWTEGGHRYPALDRKPCPWIRRFWDLDALSAVDSLDRIITMDTYVGVTFVSSISVVGGFPEAVLCAGLSPPCSSRHDVPHDVPRVWRDDDHRVMPIGAFLCRLNPAPSTRFPIPSWGRFSPLPGTPTTRPNTPQT